MNAIQSLNRRKWILSLGIVVFLLLGISGCSKEKPSLKGRWEMFVGKDPSLMGQEYGVTFTPEETKKFMLASTFGVPMKSMKKYLDLPQDQQDAVLKNEGIPTDSIDNQFKAWVRNARAVNSDLRIAIKADANTPYSVIKNVMNSLQDLRENRYNLITSLKTTSEE